MGALRNGPLLVRGRLSYALASWQPIITLTLTTTRTVGQPPAGRMSTAMTTTMAPTMTPIMTITLQGTAAHWASRWL
jgi:hypothetical protein